jgi:hypothetical protein
MPTQVYLKACQTLCPGGLAGVTRNRLHCAFVSGRSIMQGLTALGRYINVPDIRQRLVVSAALFQRISVRWHFVGSGELRLVLPPANPHQACRAA